MKVLGIVGSFRSGGNTEITVREALERAKEKGAETDIILLKDYQINPCRGCGACKDGECIQKDNMKKLIPKITSADAIIIGSPVYYGGITGGLKCLLDRFRPLKLNGDQLKNKIGGIIVVGNRWGHTNVMETINHFFCAQGMLSVPIFTHPGMGAQIIASQIGDAAKNEDNLVVSRMVGERVVEIFEAMNKNE
ncbi:TPA: flavodoxin family protein [candidate division CPR2 bacterium]|uniref:NADPH-dependent FMN reductase n=1 Tax=candidate division CPR2 bacterium GW2011_GWC1_41_48 TaxID=1618344 RepID=A0A0G0W8D6_UNCC2|nr:MAG: NADPH-dependent FMN reductase [candidate division CPR2 bacterium GW2011_GWC2_39_35]KKR27277.1 MAG: NADPH-dependent FMN reductase [candidate division CPR2 bacterium GW2011_GWD2_39_7]KKR28162.1 MAG: NADPH-dependent FMN reductase [candidate division CPR2 bacterium GW2011_GWD1_39_7]KKS09249.1 MAG: NADPH-dependent FMN reductase [candidate division CPR2 bacterium GW2011_GWC1_41_48]OGB60311.1 MAG: hypothetical protein A2Y27_00475 [candidate division CPR2 bacterium GWD1_39_7]OGB70484.1 MAG: hy